jgi:hypothetical protein
MGAVYNPVYLSTKVLFPKGLILPLAARIEKWRKLEFTFPSRNMSLCPEPSAVHRPSSQETKKGRS